MAAVMAGDVVVVAAAVAAAAAALFSVVAMDMENAFEAIFPVGTLLDARAVPSEKRN